MSLHAVCPFDFPTPRPVLSGCQRDENETTRTDERHSAGSLATWPACRVAGLSLELTRVRPEERCEMSSKGPLGLHRNVRLSRDTGSPPPSMLTSTQRYRQRRTARKGGNLSKRKRVVPPCIRRHRCGSRKTIEPRVISSCKKPNLAASRSRSPHSVKQRRQRHTHPHAYHTRIPCTLSWWRACKRPLTVLLPAGWPGQAMPPLRFDEPKPDHASPGPKCFLLRRWRFTV